MTRWNVSTQMLRFTSSVRVDQDTQGVPGSPGIVETILAKIEASDAILADVTFVGEDAKGRPMPNPNVMLEYGFRISTEKPRRRARRDEYSVRRSKRPAVRYCSPALALNLRSVRRC